MMLPINALIEWDNKKVNRVLFNNQEHIVLIPIFTEVGMPQIYRYEEIESSFLLNNFRILENDPYSEYLIRESEIPEIHKERRDKAWSLINELVELPDFGILDPSCRGKLIAERAKIKNTSIKTIYLYLLRYWKGGMTKNALLPKFKNCGAKGKRRTVKSKGVAKLGRWSNLSKTLKTNHGIAVTNEIKVYFRRGLNKFYENQHKRSLKLAYQLTLETYFHTGYEFKGDIKVPILPNTDKLPSFNQFRYFYENEYKNLSRETKKRQGEINFQLNYREILGDSTKMAFGPGSLYQIDATIVDLYLVSSFDRTKIIGRPVLYLVVDVFSRMIVGMAVLLEGPSWLGAMLALDNTVANKVEFCAEYGVEINSSQWNCHFLPKAILADRGEFEGYSVETLTSSLGVTIHNTAPYRADLKAIVERQFRILNEKFIHFEPGAVVKHRERGQKDYRLDAVLTLNEFRAIMIAHILTHNHSQYLKDYHQDEFMILDKVGRFPVDLWNWGMQNRSGCLRTTPRDVVRMNLLPRKEVTVTSRGIHFERQLYYSCDPMIKSGLMGRKRGRKSPKVTIAYDPRNVDFIYLPDSDNRTFILCPLTPASKNLKGRDLHEVQFYFHEETQAIESSISRQIKARADFHAINEHIVKNAVEQAEIAQSKTPEIANTQKLKGIRQNRLQALSLDRKNNLWDFGQSNGIPQIPPKVGNFSSENQINEKEEYITSISQANKIRKIRNRKKGEGNE